MHPKRLIPSLVLVALAFAAAHVVAMNFGDWSEPTNLGTAVNSAFGDFGAAISKKGRSLYFHSNRPGLGGPFDIYVAQRKNKNGAWGQAVRVGPPISTTFIDAAPALSRDGHYLFFSSNRPGGLGDLDIWVSYRENVKDDFAWGTPVPITSINAPAFDAVGAYFENEDGRPQLFFQSTRPGGAGLNDFYVSEQQEDGTWGSPTFVAELSSTSADNRLTIRRDGREVFFHSDRPGSEGNDLWTSTRASVSDPWSEPVNVGPPINTASADSFPGLSAKGETLYFTSDRPGSLGSDIWVSTRPGDDDDDDEDDDEDDDSDD